MSQTLDFTGFVTYFVFYLSLKNSDLQPALNDISELKTQNSQMFITPDQFDKYHSHTYTKLQELSVGDIKTGILIENGYYYYAIYGKPSTYYQFMIIFGLSDIIKYYFSSNGGVGWYLKSL